MSETEGIASVRNLHDWAMSLTVLASNLTGQEDRTDERQALYQGAFRLEKEAAERISAEPAHEPTRSILYRSAATLALLGGDCRAAEDLALEGLCGFPPPSIESELEEVVHKAVDCIHEAVSD